MEGSRHEKAVLTAVSYVLGFTAAYILFGNFTSTSTSTPAFPIADTPNVASVISATEAAVPAATKTVVANGEFSVQIGSEVKLLSVNVEETNISSDGLTQGFHYGDISSVVSGDGKFVFFCEKHASDAETCLGYVYDTEEDVIYPVSKSGTQVQISHKSAEEAIFTAVGLKIGSNYSANPAAPWVLISEADALDLQ